MRGLPIPDPLLLERHIVGGRFLGGFQAVEVVVVRLDVGRLAVEIVRHFRLAMQQDSLRFRLLLGRQVVILIVRSHQQVHVLDLFGGVQPLLAVPIGNELMKLIGQRSLAWPKKPAEVKLWLVSLSMPA